MFAGLAHALASPLDLSRVGFLVSDRAFYRKFLRSHPDFEVRASVLKEWEVVRAGLTRTADVPRLERYEQQLGDATLWHAVVADRRLCMGPLCTVRQDYRSRFSHEQLLGILDEAIEAIERLFEEVRPDLVVSFICVTFCEYLAAAVARARGVRVLNLRPTRIHNYVTFAPTIFEPSERIRSAWARERTMPIDRITAEAEAFIEEVRKGSARYEGVVRPSRKPPRLQSRKPFWRLLPSALWGPLHAEMEHRLHGDQADNHQVDPLRAVLELKLMNRWRAARADSMLAGSYLREDDLEDVDYTFFPLHTEPEVTLLVHSRPFVNQVEAVRGIARSLPIGMKLVVKEHPWSIGRRSRAFYRKLLEIPNVRLADPALESTQLIRHARMVATIAGSIGFEAVIAGRPVVTLGHTPYEFLPTSMVRRVSSLVCLPDEISDLLASYKSDEAALRDYVAATIRHSARVNLYSGLLARPGVYVPEGSEEGSDLDRLADLALRTVTEQGV